MTSSAENSSEKDQEVKQLIVDVRRRIGYTIDSMAYTPYRQLQYIAKMCGVPCNLKKEILKMVIKAKMNGEYEEVEYLLKQVREARLLRRKQKEKSLEKSKAMVAKTVLVEENNNETNSKEGQEKLRHNKVRQMLHKMVKMSSSPNVTIQQTSTHTRYRALITPGAWKFNKCLGVSPSSTSLTQQKPEARETLLQQYHKNPVFYEPVKRNVDNSSWTGGALFQRPNVVAAGYQPLPNIHSLPYNSQSYNSQSYQDNQLYIPDPQTSEISCCQSNSYKASHQYDRSSYGGFQYGIQTASTPYRMDDNYAGAQNSNATVSSTNAEPYTRLQTSYPGYNRGPLNINMDDNFVGAQNTNDRVSSTNADPYSGLQSSFTGYNSIPINNVPYGDQADNVSPHIIDVTKLTGQSESNMDTDLGMLANMAMTKTQEVIDRTRSQQYNNSLLIINEGNSSHPYARDELMAFDSNGLYSKSLTQDIPTWNNFLEQMSSNLSPGVTNKKAVVQCKYGCRIPVSSRQQQLVHEEHCYQQPVQCPLVACTYVGQLRSITLHVLNGHNNDIRSNGNGSFFIDFTDGKCSFEQVRPLLMNCPKKFCFPQLVDGRLFLLKVIGNFDSMQVVVYVQYVNDYYNWKSYVACEVVRTDGVPYQYKGEVLPLTYNPLQIISRRKCLIFNMDVHDWSQNLFVLHTKVSNCKN